MPPIDFENIFVAFHKTISGGGPRVKSQRVSGILSLLRSVRT
jgi:hypothetical protein